MLHILEQKSTKNEITCEFLLQLTIIYKDYKYLIINITMITCILYLVFQTLD